MFFETLLYKIILEFSSFDLRTYFLLQNFETSFVGLLLGDELTIKQQSHFLKIAFVYFVFHLLQHVIQSAIYVALVGLE